MDSSGKHPVSGKKDFSAESDDFNNRAERFKLIFDASPDMIFILSHNGRVLDANQAALDAYGYEHRKVFGMRFEDLLADESDIKNARKLFESVRRGNQVDYEWLTRTSQGRTIPVDVRIKSLKVSDDERHSAVVLILRDISLKHKADQAINSLARATHLMKFDEFLKESARSLAQLYGTRFAFVGRLLPDRAHVQTLVVWAGDQFVDNFTYSLEGTPCKDVMDLKMELVSDSAGARYPEDEMLIQMGIQSYFGHPMVAEGEMMGLVSVMDVNPLEVEEWAGPILGLFANRLAVEIARFEVSQQLQQSKDSLEELVEKRTRALQESNRELESFSYSVSHDLRAPLRSIDGFSKAVLEDYGDQIDEQGRGYLLRVCRATQHMGVLIDDLLELSRLGRTEFKRMSVDLCDMARQTMAQLQQGDPDRRVEFSCEIDEKVMADPVLMLLVIQNLISNAWKYTAKQDDASIELGSKHQDDETIIFVRDNGVGFDMSYYEKLFGVFQRLHRADQFEGTGIGLATVKRIILRHEGRVWADSSPGQGATFFFTVAP